MEHAIAIQESNEIAISNGTNIESILSDLELSLVGGGVGEVSPY